MFDFVERHKRIIQVFLAMIALTFMTWGIESYTRVKGGADTVATVNEAKISEREFTEEMRRQQDRLRSIFGRNFDASMMDTAESRNLMLDGMISQRLVASEAVRANLLVGDASLRETILAIPSFQAGGKFSKDQYEAVLRGQGQTPAGFEAALRYDISVSQLTRSIAETAIQPRAVAERLAALESQKRELQEATIPAAPYLAQVKVDDAAIKAYYDANQPEFRVPERVKVEFVVLSADELAASDPVTEDELKKAYEARASQYRVEEQRRASHILIQAPADAKPAEREAAKKKAGEILAELRKAPGQFGDLAKKHSQDPGSADKGGDLGLFGRGMMVKAFEDAVYGGKDGDIVGPVESEFGFHIIRVTGIEAGKARPLEDVRKELVADLTKQKGQKRFAEAAEAFGNLVYEQADSLKPVSEKFRLKVQVSDWLARTPGPEAGLLGNAKLLAALFSSDSIKAKRNTDAIEVGQNVLVSARVLEHQASTVVALEVARPGIEEKLKRRDAAKLAHKDGAAKLAELQKGGDAGLKWGPAKAVSRRTPENVPADALAKALAVDGAKVPAHFGIERDEGYALYRVAKVLAVEQRKDDQHKADLANAERSAGAEQYAAYVEALRARAKIEINKAAIEKK